jgi:hypothetical protein
MLYGVSHGAVPWAVRADGKKTFLKSERGKIERYFAKVKKMFPLLAHPTNRAPRKVARQFKAACILSHIFDIAVVKLCEKQGIQPPKDMVTIC